MASSPRKISKRRYRIRLFYCIGAGLLMGISSGFGVYVQTRYTYAIALKTETSRIAIEIAETEQQIAMRHKEIDHWNEDRGVRRLAQLQGWVPNGARALKLTGWMNPLVNAPVAKATP